MNTRRKMFSGLVLAAAALLALSGCKKDEGEKVILSAEFEQPAGGQKTYINDHSVRWTSGDAVRVNAATEAVAVSDGAVEVTASDNGYAVVYPFEGSTLSSSGSACTGGTVKIPADQAYATTEGGQQKMSSPMAARLDAASGRLYFKNLHSIIRVDVTTGNEDFVLESITITSTAKLAGTLGFSFQEGGTTVDAASAPTLDTSTLDKKSVTLNFSEPITLAAHTTDKAFYLCVAPFTSTNLEIKVTGTPQGGDYAGKKGSYVFSRSGKSLNRSIMAEVKADFGDAAFEPFVPRFSVGAGTTVEFAPGNLQWSATNGGSELTTHAVAGDGDGTAAGTWRFAEHQWDYVGDATYGTVSARSVKCNNKLIAADYTGWIDLFGWGTSGYNSKYPYMTSDADEDYGNGESNIAETNYDWGVYNAIYNPKTEKTDNPGTWRTLTNAEWTYLLGTSGSTRGGVHKDDWWIYNMVKIKAAYGTKNVTGLIIYPDGVTAQPDGLSETLTPNNKTAVAITKADFEKLEALGCVFLPAAGNREGTSVRYAGNIGFYWSSTYYDGYDACSLGFRSEVADPTNGSGSRCGGLSVRLVKNVK